MDSSTTRTDLVICKYISQAMEANGITQADLSKALEGRSKGYISDRVLGKRSWAISEARERKSQITDDLIDRIAAHPEDYDVAANKDSNARLEAETPDE